MILSIEVSRTSATDRYRMSAKELAQGRTWIDWIITSQKLQYPENERNNLREIMELGPDKDIPGIYFASIKEGLPIKFGTSSKSAHWYDRGGAGRQVWAKP